VLVPRLTTPDFFESHSGLWAFGSTVATFLTVLVGGVGLFFVWRQLRASKTALIDSTKSAQAAADAAKSTFATTRPWLKLEVTKAYIYLNEANSEDVGCQINYRIENIGRTPALRAGIVFKPIPMGYGIATDMDSELEELRQTKPRTPRVLFPNDVVEEGLSLRFAYPPQVNESMVGFKVIVAAVYNAAPEGETYWTPGVFGLQHETPPPDLIYRFYRGMGSVPCMVLLDGEATPPPT